MLEIHQLKVLGSKYALFHCMFDVLMPKCDIYLFKIYTNDGEI